jgi:hypothetical protein
MVIQQEMLAVLNVCKSIDLNYQPDIVCLLVVKRHDIRFFYPQQEITPSGEVNGKNTATPAPADAALSLHISNPPIGTYVDNTVTRCDANEFYLVSHSTQQDATVEGENHQQEQQQQQHQISTKGTLRPILYQVLYNTTLLRPTTVSGGNDTSTHNPQSPLPPITTQQLAQLTFHLSFQRQSTPQSSSVALPVEYADKMCSRSRLWLPLYQPDNLHYFMTNTKNPYLNNQQSTHQFESKPVKFIWDDVVVWEEGLHPNLWELPFWI